MLNLHIDLENLQHAMKSDCHLHEAIQSVILHCAHDPKYVPDTQLHEKSVSHLIEKHQRIGLHHIIYGRVSKSIVQYQETFTDATKKTTEYTPESEWAIQLTTNSSQ